LLRRLLEKKIEESEEIRAGKGVDIEKMIMTTMKLIS